MKAIADILWSERTRAEFGAWAERGTVVVVPIGSIEQHGVHLPIDTDCRTADYVARQAACLAEDVPVLVTPIIPFGVSPHHMVFGGTISLRVETVLHLLEDVCASIVAHGFERVVILSGHGGNAGTISAAALELRHRLQRQIHALCWWDLIPELWDQIREGPNMTIGHSGEMETSAILVLAPALVRQDRLVVVPGISDDPAVATAAKGERLLQAGAQALAGYLRRLAAEPGREIVGVQTVTGQRSG
jgi:creatinine amidohydrolase